MRRGILVRLLEVDGDIRIALLQVGMDRGVRVLEVESEGLLGGFKTLD